MSLVAPSLTFHKHSQLITRSRIRIRTLIIGLGNNLAFLRDVIRNNKFISGHYGTKFIEEEYPEGFNGVQLDDSESRRLIAVGAMIQWLAAGPGDNNGAFVVTLPARGEQQEECCYAAMVSIGGAPEIDIGK
jgi:pyruvate carboxylase